MADEEDTLDVLVEQLGFALDPLVAGFDSTEAFRDFLEELGWDFNAVPAALDALRGPIGQANSGAQGEISTAQRPDMRNRVQAAFEAISTLGSGGGLPAEFANEFPRQLVDYLLVTWLIRHQPRVGYVLMLMGIVRMEAKAATATRPAYLHRKFAFEDLGAFFADPIKFWKDTYRWGQSTFDGERLIDGFYGLFEAWDWRVREELLDEATLQQLSIGAIDPTAVSGLNLRLVFFEHAVDELGLEAGVGLFLLPETASAKPGFSLMPYGRGEFDIEIPLTDLLTLGIKAGIALDGGVGINVRPRQGHRVLRRPCRRYAVGGVGQRLRASSTGQGRRAAHHHRCERPEPSRVRRHHHRSGHALPLGRQVRGLHGVRAPGREDRRQAVGRGQGRVHRQAAAGRRPRDRHQAQRRLLDHAGACTSAGAAASKSPSRRTSRSGRSRSRRR